jgi:pyrimidine-nucleoside phosphorylase
MNFNPIDFIALKKDGKEHAPQEIRAFIDNVVSGDIPDYQVTAWLMAVCLNDLSFAETSALTMAIAESGKIYHWDKSGPPIVDKHSTGGVGDSATLIVAPLVASMGMRMGKHSGRGLGHTGGTIDKLESIPGFRTDLSEEEFKNIVNSVGCAIAGQDEEITPADGILYGLRDVTATVNHQALIASSIMSKKIAGGAKSILLDIKVGSGAFMKDLWQARSLADLLIRLGESAGVNVKSLMTSMDVPLGRAVGNALEVKEAINVLDNKTPPDDPLRVVSIEIAARLSGMCGIESLEEARQRAARKIEDGDALNKFRKMIEMQGGDPGVVDEPDRIIPSAGTILKISSLKEGYIAGCDALKIGELVRDLGGGRKSKSDAIDREVGLILKVRQNDRVEYGQTLCEVHKNDAVSETEAAERVLDAFRIVSVSPGMADLILN